jgi:hypothetical protein
VRDSSEVIWGIGRVLEKNFYRLPFTPPCLVANPILQPQNQGQAESGVVICGGYIKFVWFEVVHQKNHQVTWLCHKAEAEDRMGNQCDWFGVAGRRKLQGGGHTSGSQG